MFNFGEQIQWNNTPVLEVEGSAVTEGECVSAEGKKFNFTDSLMLKILSHVTDPIPMGLLHNNEDVFGYAPKVGYDPVSKSIPFKGFIFDNEKRKYVETNGFDKVSPEMTFIFDEKTGEPVDGYITKLAFVKTPAMSGTQVSCASATFSANQSTIKTEGKNMQNDVIVFYPNGTYKPEPASTSSVPVITPTVTGPANFETEISRLKTVIANFEAEVATLNQQVTSTDLVKAQTDAKNVELEDNYKKLSEQYGVLMTEKVDTYVAELKKLGFTSPEIIGKDLPSEQRITILKQMKENFVTSAPGNTPTTPITVPNKSVIDKAALLAKMGVSEENAKLIKVN